MPGDDFDMCFVEEVASSRSDASLREGDDIGANARRLGIDIDADDARVRHGHSRAEDETGLRGGAAGTVHDRGRFEARLRAPALRSREIVVA